MSFSKIYYRTDSEVVLKYIRNEEKNCVYVGNRIAEMREKSKVQQWKYCPSKANLGDDVSFGMKPFKTTSECRWFVALSSRRRR